MDFHELKVGDLVVYRHAAINYFMVMTSNPGIGVISKIYDEDIFDNKPKQEPLLVKMALIIWTDGSQSRNPVMLLEKYEDIKS